MDSWSAASHRTPRQPYPCIPAIRGQQTAPQRNRIVLRNLLGLLAQLELTRCDAMRSHAGKFLVAKPVLQDATFRQTVVLLSQPAAEGGFGLVVTRAITVEGLPFAVFDGGPCASQGLLMLHGHADWSSAPDEPAPKEVAPGVFLGDAS